MDRKEKITVNIINRNYPPSPGITGESALDITKYLLLQNFAVNIIHVDAPYSGGGSIETTAGSIYKIKTFYNGKNKILRLFGNLYEGWRLINTSKNLKPDVTICMTDPPMLNIWASLLLGKKHKWIWWSMDLYPEAFVAAELISEKNFFFKQMNRWLQEGYPSHVISLGPCQSLFLQKKLNNKVSFTQLPCGIFSKKNDLNRPKWAEDTSKLYLGYCGNLGEAHSLAFLHAVINNFDTKKYTLILSVYGSKAKEMTEYAKGKNGITILPSVKRDELGFIDIHLASLKPGWVNVCVPSKTVSSVCAESAFLYCGIPESDNWELLKDAGWIVKDDEMINEWLASFFSSLTKEKLSEKKQKAKLLAILLTEMKLGACDKINQEILSIVYENK